MAGVAPDDVDPVTHFPWRITRQERIVTAGSCFAQHIARYLAAAGFTHHVTEPGHPAIHRDIRAAHNYGLFSARYGNVYTARQLRQLFERALGRFAPAEDAWTAEAGGVVDPFRPTIQPGGFSCVEELRADRASHLEAVRRAMAEAEVFVFTLGLTETWISRADGAVFPLCPGVEGGVFDAGRHAFVNLDAAEVIADMEAAVALLRGVNPGVRVVLTVSPVPLAATALDRHVLVSTTVSKAILRVAADALAARLTDVAYFPSYEIVTGAFARGRYFGPDLRAVTDAGVDHVMRLFFRHATEAADAGPAPAAVEADAEDEDALERVTEALCEEALLDR